MNQEIEQLKREIQDLREIINLFIIPGKYLFQRDLELSDNHNIVFSGKTGSKMGTSATQKLSFYGLTPIVQQSSTGETTGASAANLTNTTTFNGNNGSTAYTVLDIVKHLKNYGLLLK